MADHCSFEVIRRSDSQEFTWNLGEYTDHISEALDGMQYESSKQDAFIYEGTSIYDFAVEGETEYYDLSTGAYFKIEENSGTYTFAFFGPDEDHTLLYQFIGSGYDWMLFVQPYGTDNINVISVGGWQTFGAGIYVHKHNFSDGDAWLDGVDILGPESYDYGGTSGPGGGQGGTFDNSSDAVDFAALPTGGAAASGLVTMFAPTTVQLADFGNFLWANLFDATYDSFLTSLKKWVNDPIESVIQLACFPVTPPSGSAQTLKFCGIASDLVGAGVSMNVCTNQFMDFDFGQLSTPAYWKQALDYSPYTQVSIYLPYIGICPLKSDDVIDATLHLKYHIDLLTGGFSAELKCSKNINGTSLASVLYNWSGNMATQIPITSSNFSQVFGSMMTAVAAIGVGAISGGLGAAAGGAAAEGASVGAGSAMLSGAGQGLAANIGNVINSKPHVTQSGRLDGTVGALSQFTPYLIIERPVQSLSAKFQSEQGYPSNTVQTLKNLSGLTVCEAPIMTGFSGVNDDELAEIKSILCSGVIL